MVRAMGSPNQVQPVQPAVRRPGVQRPGAPRVPGPERPGRQPPGGLQATNGTDTARISQQAVQASNGRAPATPPNPVTYEARAAGVPPPPPALTPLGRREQEQENARVTAPPPPEPAPAQIPQILQEFAPGEAAGPGQNTDIYA